MKKIIISSLLLFSIFLFTGCGQKQTDKNQMPKEADPLIRQSQEPSESQWQNGAESQLLNNSAQKTYQNQKYGFGFNYPGSYKIQENDWEKEPQPGGSIYLVQLGDETITDFEAEFDKGILIYVVKVEKGPDGADPLMAPSGADPVSKKDIIIGGQKARNYNNGQIYTVAKNGYGYWLILGDQASRSTKDNFAKIVSSFEFIK
ncbi:MAG TPA: hypothetical protein PLK35_02715 [Candidatus Moranbacteria bacterium]|nr:hypothetical protein [Candidatus Moranbacteria bacterium]